MYLGFSCIINFDVFFYQTDNIPSKIRGIDTWGEI